MMKRIIHINYCSSDSLLDSSFEEFSELNSPFLTINHFLVGQAGIEPAI